MLQGSSSVAECTAVMDFDYDYDDNYDDDYH